MLARSFILNACQYSKVIFYYWHQMLQANQTLFYSSRAHTFQLSLFKIIFIHLLYILISHLNPLSDAKKRDDRFYSYRMFKFPQPIHYEQRNNSLLYFLLLPAIESQLEAEDLWTVYVCAPHCVCSIFQLHYFYY